MTSRSAWAPERRLLTVGLVFLVTAVAFEGLAVPTVLPATLDALGGVGLYGWAFSGYWLTNLVGIVLAGAEADRRGPLWPFLAGVVLNAVGLVLAATATDMAWVVLGRAVQGLGSGGIGALVYVAIARGYDVRAQPRMIAVISSAWVLPGLIGPLIAGLVTEHLGWQWVFAGLAPLLPLAAPLLVGTLRALDPPSGGEPAADRGQAPVAVVLAAGCAALLAGVSIGQPLPAMALAVAGLVVARWALLRLLPPGSLTGRSHRGAPIAALAAVSIAFFGAEAYVPLAVASVRHEGAVAGGLALTAAAVTWAAGSWVQARFAARGVRRGLVRIGLLLVLAAIVGVTPVATTGVPTWVAPLAWAVAGLGMGLAYSTTTLLIIETAPPGGEGAASASVQLANTLGIAIGTGFAGGIVSLLAGSAGLAPGIAVANVAMVAIGGLGLLTVGRLPEPGPGTPLTPAAEAGPAL